MTTISGGTAALPSLAALYAKETGASADTPSAGTGSGLTSDQVNALVGIVEGGSTSATNSLGPFGNTSASSTGATDLSAILDKIQAQASGTAAEASDGSASSAQTDQQKAAAMMQSIYQTQQVNLFTLLG